MRALILAHGTRGDVQPYAALAYALKGAGHDAVLGAPKGSASLAEESGIAFAPLPDEMNERMDDPAVRQAIETNYRGFKGKLTGIREIFHAKSGLRRLLDATAAVPTTGVDVVVHPVNSPLQHLAEKLGVPAVAVGLQPGWVPSPSIPSPMLAFRIPKAFNRASYWLNGLVLQALVRSGAGWRRETLGLPRRPHQNDALRTPEGGPATVLQAFSRHVLPPAAHYPDWTHTTGFWFLPAAREWTPSQRLQAFLDAGDPPIYIGFGSMAGSDPARVGRSVTEAARLAGVRVVLVTGWGGLHVEVDPEQVFVLDAAPHDWLFPRMAAIVHHGGAGTTAAALASGRPQVVCPFVADQPYWARRMQVRGVAPEPQPQRHLTPESLAAAIRRTVTDNAMSARAAELGAKIRAENGVGNAVAVLEQLNATSRALPELTPAQESLYLTLCGRALDHRSPRPILADELSDRVVRQIGYDCAKQPHAARGMRDIAWRTKTMDQVVRGFIATHPDAVVLDLGAGLDTRADRIDPPSTVSWYDVDFPEVADLRRQVLPHREGTHTLGRDLTDPDLLDGIPSDRPTVIVADGPLAFLSHDDVVALLTRLTSHFPGGELAFNGYTRFHVWALKRYGGTRSIADAVAHPGFDDPSEPEDWNPELTLIEEILHTRSSELSRYPTGIRLLNRLAGLSTSVSRRGTTVLRYRF